jgi:hypothetical protein
MSHLQYPSNSLLTLDQNTLNHRTRSFLPQHCPPYAPSSHLTATQPVKHSSVSSTKYTSNLYPTTSKEN